VALRTLPTITKIMIIMTITGNNADIKGINHEKSNMYHTSNYQKKQRKKLLFSFSPF